MKFRGLNLQMQSPSQNFGDNKVDLLLNPWIKLRHQFAALYHCLAASMAESITKSSEHCFSKWNFSHYFVHFPARKFRKTFCTNASTSCWPSRLTRNATSSRPWNCKSDSRITIHRRTSVSAEPSSEWKPFIHLVVWQGSCNNAADLYSGS